ncbi:MAG: hypothetical protein KC503_09030 [Myxococcales bacterium]|nr:hypothetical protein [Myxococcales bacterium]
MLVRIAALSFSLAILAGALWLPACGDDASSTKDAAVADGAKDGSSSKEQGIADLPVPGENVVNPDRGSNEGGTVDGTPADGPVGESVTRPDQGGGADGSTAARCQIDADCKVFQDCCSCSAVLNSVNPPICKKACKQNTCDAWFTRPIAYCVNGRCKVGEGAANSCGNTTKACQGINDCCNCLAVPASNTTIPNCSIATCFVATCTAEGLANAKPQCVNGNCRLVVSP